jgi:hypothetical protein
MAPRSGKIRDPKTLATVKHTRGEMLYLYWDHEIEGQPYENRVHMSVVQRIEP